MQLVRTQVTASPLSSDRVRLEGEVTVADGGSLDAGPLWFDFPEELSGSLSERGDPWLVALAPLAAMRGEALDIPLPVDPRLLQGVQSSFRTWRTRPPTLAVPELEEPAADGEGDAESAEDTSAVRRPGRSPAHAGGARGGSGTAPSTTVAVPDAGTGSSRRAGATGCFFWGDVDSYFTLLRHEDGVGAVHYEIAELLYVAGVDRPPASADSFLESIEELEPVAERLGKPLLGLATNLGTIRWPAAEGAKLSRGARLAATALAIEDRYTTILLPWRVPDLRGTPVSGADRFTELPLSTTRTRIVYDGSQFPWTDKVARVARSPAALDGIRECWRETGENCGRCVRCQRAMATLEVLGVREACAAFPEERFRVDRLAELRISSPTSRKELARVIPFALAHGRRDVARALRRCLRRSDFRRRRTDLYRWMRRSARRVGELGRQLADSVRERFRTAGKGSAEGPVEDGSPPGPRRP